MEVRTVGAETFVVSCVATTLGIVVTVAFLTFNVFHRNKRFIKMSSPKLNVLISVGGLCLNIVCLMFGMDFFLAERYPEATVTCQIRLWLITIGVSLVFGPMFAKAWRVYQIFQNAGVKRVVIKDIRLFVMASAFVFVDMVILTIWQGVDTMTSKETKYLMITNGGGKQNNSSGSEYVLIQECSSHGTSGWLAFLLLWKTCLLGYGLYLAWQTRNVTLPAMRDSPSIIISIMSTLLLSAPTFMLTSLLRHSPDGIYITEILIITVCSTVVQITVFLPKVRFWWKSPLEKQSKLSVTMYDFKKSSTSTQDLDIYQIQSENTLLKINMKEKLVQIKDLERKVSHLAQRLSAVSNDDDRRDSGLDVDLGISDIKDEPCTMDSSLRTDPDSSRVVEPESYTDVLTTEEGGTPQADAFDRTQSDTSEMKSYKAKKEKRRRKKMLTSTPDIYKQCEKNAQVLTKSDDFFDVENSNARFMSKCWTFSSMRSRQDIVGSVTKCYDLEDNEDTFSYVSTYLPPPPPSEQIEFSLRNNSLCTVNDNAVLSNDMLYPTPHGESSTSPRIKEPEINGNTILNDNCITLDKTCYV